MKSYVVIEGKKQGPFSSEEITEKLGSGELKAEDLAWNTGMKEWKPLAELHPELMVSESENRSSATSRETELETVAEPSRELPTSHVTDILRPGSTFGQYRVEQLLGRGGMGEVYEVSHNDLGTPHALKLISEEPSVLFR